MPNTQSAKKALRQTNARRGRNLLKKGVYKELAGEYKKLAAAGDVAGAQAKLPSLYKAIDKAAKTKVIKERKADRMKARLTQLTARSTKASS